MNATPFQYELPGTPAPVEVPGPDEPAGETPRRPVSTTHKMLSAWVPNEVHDIVTRRAAKSGMSTSAFLGKNLTYYMTMKHGNNK